MGGAAQLFLGLLFNSPLLVHSRTLAPYRRTSMDNRIPAGPDSDLPPPERIGR